MNEFNNQLPSMPRELDIEAVRTIALGATILGTGGGGDPYVGRLMTEKAIGDYGRVKMVSPQDVPDDGFMFVVGMMGAPAVMMEKIPSGREALQSVELLERHMGKKLTHICCMEAGGINSMIPIAVAAQTGLPLVDADGMGRAFPELQMMLPTLSGIKASPLSVVDEKGNCVVLDGIDNIANERIARKITVQMGATSILSFYPMTGAQMRQSLIPNTYALTYRLGAALLQARKQHRDPIGTVAEAIGGRILFWGKVMDVLRRTTAGFNRGEATFEGIAASTGQGLTIQFQNEFLIARIDDKVVTTTPDLICVVDAQNGEPITAETLRYGQRVAVIGAPCYERWRTPEGLKIVGPKYFGYDTDYVPFS